jgi:hypothetical protein
MRELGLNPSNGGITRTIRRHAGLLVPYDPEIIELFFIVDGDLAIYLIPSRVIAGRVQILLRTYRAYIVGNAAGLMCSRPCVA